jgi:acyl dehydratase
MTNKQIQFDDIAALQKCISDEYGEFGKTVVVDQDRINQFADVTEDHQWIHVDVERAKKESPYKTPIAHGFLTLSLLPALEKDPFEVIGYGNAVNYGSDKLRFLSPVPVGSKIHARSRLISAEAGKHGTRVEMVIEIHVVDSDKPALIYSEILLYVPKACT